MDEREIIEYLKKENQKNVASVNYLRGYTKGLEERLSRLERSKDL